MLFFIIILSTPSICIAVEDDMVWSSEIEDDFGYTQIFKTAAEMTNTAIATNYRGYANEWNRIWAMKLREHKVDIERAMLFSQRARSNSIQYTDICAIYNRSPHGIKISFFFLKISWVLITPSRWHSFTYSVS